LEALISFLPTPADGAIGALDWTSTERKKLAQRSVNYACPTCGCKAIDLLPKLKPKSESEQKPKSKFQKEIEKLQEWQSLEHGKKDEDTKEDKDKNGEDVESAAHEPSLVVEDNPTTSTVTTTPVGGVTENTTTTGQPTVAVTDFPQPGASEPERVNPNQVAPQQQMRNDVANPLEEQLAPLLQNEAPILQQQQQQQQEDNDIWSWMSDPVLHGIIVTLAILCFLLFRKLQTLMEELATLKEVLEG
jgi:hypothetical protein